MSKEKLFSVTLKDLKFEYFRGSGPGGQHRNKTSTACRCTHIKSGAYATAQDSKSQHQNKTNAFKRMIETDKFKKWFKLECSRRLGVLSNIEDEVDYEMKHNIKIESIDENGKWTEFKEDF